GGDAGRADPPRRRLRASADPRREPLPGLPHRGIPLLMRSLFVLIALGLLAAASPGRTDVRFVDSVVAEVDGTVVAASDVALARALGLFGLTPAVGPLSPAEVERYADGRLLVVEATRIGAEVAEAERTAAWDEVAARMGGQTALAAWLAAADVDEGWVRRMV